MEMQQRIDALIQMRREKPEHQHYWDRLRTALINEVGLLTDEQKAHLNSAFKETQQEELLRMWDDRFHEVLITGKMTDGYSIALDNSAYASATARQLTSASLAIGKETLSERDIKEMKAEMAKYNAGQARK